MGSGFDHTLLQSQGWARRLHGNILEVYSAGTAPHVVDPRVVRVMAESGVDISSYTSNHVDEYIDIPFDLVVTVCDDARELCPAFPGKGRSVHRTFVDPPTLVQETADEESALTVYRRVRDEIRDFVADIIKLL